ncbi:hypothetical protein DFP73DRAFT_476894 [Morchella snyderi]|nr:hypothetical protein DFP73DRAFT_476894 [Morchella snyderi]
MTVFRVRGIPGELALGALEKNLAEADRNGNLKIKITIAPSCYDRTQTALVQFDPLPSYLQDAGSAEWDGYDMEVETEEGELFDITIDKDFFGLTQLYPTKSDDITADIIAVTGLAGHAFGSWRGKGNLGRMWLRDFLSVDLPNCRTLTYGYDSRLRSAGVHQIRDYSRGFLEELKKARISEEERERPIIFIGHSFGGIIVAQSLVRSKECNPRDDPAVYAIHQATRGVIFYGTPHRGFLVDDILGMLNPQENSERVKLVNSINKNSDLLHSELERFVDLAMQLRIVSFYERLQTRRPVLGATGFARTGEYVTTVDTDSALLNLGAAIEKKIPVDADHTEIVKFKNKQNQAYSSTLFYLQEFEKEIATPSSSGRYTLTPVVDRINFVVKSPTR